MRLAGLILIVSAVTQIASGEDAAILEGRLRSEILAKVNEVNPVDSATGGRRYISFGFISDIHKCRRVAGDDAVTEPETDYWYGSAGVLTEAEPSIRLLGAVAADAGLDAVICGGDFSTAPIMGPGKGLSETEYTNEIWNVKAMFDSHLPADLPRFTVDGNHERHYSTSGADMRMSDEAWAYVLTRHGGYSGRIRDMSRLLFFSDSHGVHAAIKALRNRIETDAPDLVCFLGDALYHGPRNGVPLDYDTKKSADEFNAIADRIVAVRGNCDAEIDQMMLSFPMLGPYATVMAGDIRLFLSHGHVWGPDEQLPPLPAGGIVATGHTHVPTVERKGDVWCFNPGSISIPKGGSEPSYALLEDRLLTIRRLVDGATLRVANLA